MYLTITPHKLNLDSHSCRGFVNYLEKENRSKDISSKETFFNQNNVVVPAEEVIQAIDGNTSKLERAEPRYYSITVSPSQKELAHIGNDKQKLKEYTREIMKKYPEFFNREIFGRSVRPEDILYFGKIESTQTYKWTGKEIKENSPYLKKITELKKSIKQIQQGESAGNMERLNKQLDRIISKVPHQIDGKVIEQGMRKPGLKTHIHLIVSRKDVTNTYSLSPGSKYRSSEVVLNGKLIKRGFSRDRFFQSAEKTFDRLFNYNRNYAEMYSSRKTFLKDPKEFYAGLQHLSPTEKKKALAILNQSKTDLPNLHISPGQMALALNQIKKAMGVAVQSSSIGY